MAYPSTFLDIQNQVIMRATLDPVLDLQATKDWINKTYAQVCIETEANPATATMTLTPSSASYTLPAAVGRIKQMALKPAGSTQFNPPLVLTTLDEILNRRMFGGDAGLSNSVIPQSTLYTLTGTSALELWPTPTAADVITIYYFAYPTVLTGNTDVPAIDEPYSSRLLEYGALVQAGDFKGDPATADWENQFEQWMGKYLQHLAQKRGEQPGQFHVWGDGWSPDATGTVVYGY